MLSIDTQDTEHTFNTGQEVSLVSNSYASLSFFIDFITFVLHTLHMAIGYDFHKNTSCSLSINTGTQSS